MKNEAIKKIRNCGDADFERIYEIINDAATAYRGVIPADRWKEPYMSKEELSEQIRDGVNFWGYEEGGCLLGVMGIQDRGDVSLIRHAYVSTKMRRSGIGTRLLNFLLDKTENPVLIGTWADANWAIDFYKKNGFSLVNNAVKISLLKKYWGVPDRQIETSVVLADKKWMVINNMID